MVGCDKSVDDNCDCWYHYLWACLEDGLGAVPEAKSMIDESLENIGELKYDANKTLLHIAVNNCDAETIQYLIDKGCQVNAQDDFGKSPLEQASDGENWPTVEVLLKNNADIFVRSDCREISELIDTVFWLHYMLFWGDTASLSKAELERYQYIIVTVFSQIDAVFSETSSSKRRQVLLDTGNMPKYAMVILGNANTAKCILEEGNYPLDYRASEFCNNSALDSAMMYARKENANLLIEHGANVDLLDEDGDTSLTWYYEGLQDVDEHGEVLANFIRHSDRWSAALAGRCRSAELEKALIKGNGRTVRTVLLSLNGLNIDEIWTGEETLLCCLVKNTNIDISDAIAELDIKFDVNYRRSSDEYTPLMVATREKHLANVEFLLQKGADVNARTTEGFSVLSCLMIFCCDSQDWQIRALRIFKLLLYSGAKDEDVQLLFGVHALYYDTFQNDRCYLHQKVLIAQLALLEAQKSSSLTDSTREIIDSYPMLKSLFEKCTRDLGVLKEFEVVGTVTLFKLLTEEEEKIAAYTRNEDFFSKFTDALGQLSGLESYYLNFTKYRLQRALDLAKLQDDVALVMEGLFGFSPEAQHFILLRIISYLDSQDLNELLKVNQ